MRSSKDKSDQKTNEAVVVVGMSTSFIDFFYLRAAAEKKKSCSKKVLEIR